MIVLCSNDICCIRLRLLLAEEEEEYISEMEAKQETIEERQKKMVERAKMLKQKREAERLLIVEDKLDQQFRYFDEKGLLDYFGALAKLENHL